jgi:hypothetical protein
MTTSKRSSTPAKSGKHKHDRAKGISFYKALETLATSEGDTKRARLFKAIRECLEQKATDEK